VTLLFAEQRVLALSAVEHTYSPKENEMARLPQWLFAIAIAAVVFAAAADGVASPIAFNPLTGRVYFGTAFDEETVSVVDGVSTAVIAKIVVGGTRTSVAVNPTSNRIYVSHGAFVAVIGGVSNTVIDEIPFAASVNDIAVDPGTSRIYVALADVNEIKVIDAASNAVLDTVRFRGDETPRELALHPQKHRLYASMGNLNSPVEQGHVVAINTSRNNVVATIPVGSNPFGLAVDYGLNRIYVANNLSGGVMVIDGATNTLLPGPPPPQECCPVAVSVNQKNDTVYVDGPDDLMELDALTYQVVRTFPGVRNPVVVDERRGRLYILGRNLGVVLEDELLLNPSFEQRPRVSTRFPPFWKRRNFGGKVDLLSSESHDRNLSFLITGASGITKSLFQEIAVSGDAGAIIHVEGFSKAIDAAETGGQYGVVFRVYYTDGTQRTVHLPFSRGTHDWERQVSRIIATKPFSRVSYRILYDDQAGKAWFDGMHVTVENPTP
jgi:YVTN family beta-propeller protein